MSALRGSDLEDPALDGVAAGQGYSFVSGGGRRFLKGAVVVEFVRANSDRRRGGPLPNLEYPTGSVRPQ